MSNPGIDQTLCQRFEQAWVEQQPRSIATCLPPEDCESYLPTLLELVGIDLEFQWKHHLRKTSANETTLAADELADPPLVEDYLREFSHLNRPELLLQLLQQEFWVRARFAKEPAFDEYQKRFPDLEINGACLAETDLALTVGSREEIEHARSGDEREPQLGSFGEYELLEEIGRGGMGVVFRARHRNIKRIVALKVIRAKPIIPAKQARLTVELERFKTEASITANLEHDHIVTVYDVGEHRGYAYYTMSFVDGPSLMDVVSGGPLDCQRAAAYVLSASRAVHEAHQAGILHRDIKPHNLMLHRSTDRVLVADFGLAKLLESGPELTKAGEVMGTPSYMSPEQAVDSSKVSQTSDVYSLGATLYHLIAARPPFQAATPIETLRQVIQQTPVSPKSLNPEIDRDLQTICQKCLRKEPEKRYATCAELADDLQRYLEDRPILARPVGVPERVARWCRRNPLISAAVFSAAACLLLALGSLVYGYVTVTDALDESLASHRESRKTIDYFFTQVSENVLLDRPGMQPLREDLLRHALEHYQRLLAQRSADQRTFTEFGMAHYRVGCICTELGMINDAASAFEKAMAIQQKLRIQRPEETDNIRKLARTLNAMGGLYGQQKAWQKAATAFQQSKDFRETLITNAMPADPASVDDQRMYANSLMNLGVIARAQGNSEAASQYFSDATTMRDALLEHHVSNRELLRDSAMGFFNLANYAQDENDLGESIRYLDEAIPIFEQLNKELPDDLKNQHRLSICYRRLGHLVALKTPTGTPQNSSRLTSASGTPEENAHDFFQNSLDIIQRLAYENPTVIAFQTEFSGTLIDLGVMKSELQHYADAEQVFLNAMEVLNKLTDPNTPVARRDLAVANRELGVVLYVSRKSPRLAQKHLTQAVRQFEQLLAEDPTNPAYREEHLLTCEFLDELLSFLEQGDIQ